MAKRLLTLVTFFQLSSTNLIHMALNWLANYSGILNKDVKKIVLVIFMMQKTQLPFLT